MDMDFLLKLWQAVQHRAGLLLVVTPNPGRTRPGPEPTAAQRMRTTLPTLCTPRALPTAGQSSFPEVSRALPGRRRL